MIDRRLIRCYDVRDLIDKAIGALILLVGIAPAVVYYFQVVK